uniref:Uncharacterized protein n=1 Tax=Vitis vinifera TaxID=29760 RepID=F6I2M1_VITVI
MEEIKREVFTPIYRLYYFLKPS